MKKVGNNMIERRRPEQNRQYKEKLWTIGVNNKCLLISYICILYIIHKLQLYSLFMGQ